MIPHLTILAVVVRKQIEEAIKNQGGEYRGDLTKEVSHLIAFNPSGNKYNFARLWGIKVVSIEWLQQSLERGMILDETLFDPLLDESQRGRDAWIRRTTSASSLSKRPRDDDAEFAPTRKLRRTTSARFSSQNKGIWSDIMGREFGISDDTIDPWAEQQGNPQRPSNMAPQSMIEEVVNSLAKDTASQQSLPITLHPTNALAIFHEKRFVLRGFTEKEASLQCGCQISVS